MSTRAIYTFIDASNGDRFNVYKHHDGYPSGAARALELALSYAWELNRFEADEFAAAFVAANKAGAGGVRLLKSGEWTEAAPRDIEYRYEVVQFPSGRVQVYGYAVTYGEYGWRQLQLFDRPLKLVYSEGLEAFDNARVDDARERTEFDPLIRASRQVLSGLKLDGVPTAAEVRDFAATLNAFGLGVVDIKRASTC